jgi:rhodanese-related sulfurtransferase
MLFGRPRVPELSPAEVHERLQRDELTLIDVREPHEHAAAAVAGAHLVPLGSLDPKALPGTPGRLVVFLCASGQRSAAAAARCLAAGLAEAANMRGGLLAWRAAGLPVAPGAGPAARR